MRKEAKKKKYGSSSSDEEKKDEDKTVEPTPNVAEAAVPEL